MAPVIPVPEQNLVKARAEAITTIGPLRGLADTLVIETEEDYIAADGDLQRISKARRWWDAKANEIISPARKVLDLLYDLRNEFSKPLEADEKTIKGKMVDFKTRERNQLRIAEEKRQEDIRKTRELAEEKERKAAAARTKPMQTKLAIQAAELQQVVAMQEVAGPAEEVKAEGSSVRSKKVAQVKDLKAMLAGIISGEIPDDIISINQTELNTAYRLEAAIVAAWPGIEIVDEITIARTRRY